MLVIYNLVVNVCVCFDITDCPQFKLHNGNFRVVETSVFLYVSSLKCNKGYQLNGGGVNHCEHGKWKFPLQTCTSELPNMILQTIFYIMPLLFNTDMHTHILPSLEHITGVQT